MWRHSAGYGGGGTLILLMAIATRLMGLILAAIAVAFIPEGLVGIFPALALRG